MTVFVYSHKPQLAVEGADAILDCFLRLPEVNAVMVDYRDEVVMACHKMLKPLGFKTPIEYKNEPGSFHTISIDEFTPYEVACHVKYHMETMLPEVWAGPFLNYLKVMRETGTNVIVANPDAKLLAKAPLKDLEQIVQIVPKGDEDALFISSSPLTLLVKESSDQLWKLCKSYVEEKTGETFSG